MLLLLLAAGCANEQTSENDHCVYPVKKEEQRDGSDDECMEGQDAKSVREVGLPLGCGEMVQKHVCEQVSKEEPEEVFHREVRIRLEALAVKGLKKI